MTFEQFAVAVHDWQSRLTPAQARAEVARQLGSAEGVEGLRPGISIEAVLVMVRMGLGPGMCPVGVRARCENVLEPKPPSPPRESKKAKPPHGRRYETRGRPSTRAQALVREQLNYGPRPEASVMAAASFADIPERAVIAAADALGVRTRKGALASSWVPYPNVTQGCPVSS
jgi:hypothetical protein